MREWWSSIINKYWDEVDLILETENEKIVYRLTGVFEGFGHKLTGLIAVTDKSLRIRGKTKVGAWTPAWQMGGTKRVIHIPLNAIYEIIQKKHNFVLRLNLDYMGDKYIGKRGKIKIKLHQGKEGKEKESKTELFQRADELAAYLKTNMAA